MAKTKAKQEVKVTPRFKQRPRYPTFIKHWRKHRGRTQAWLAEYLGCSTGTVSQIENGNSPYDQPFLEGVAEALETDPASLLMRNPQAPDALWSLIDRVKPDQVSRVQKLISIFLETEAD